MLSRLSHKQQFYGAVISILVLFILAFQLALQPTLALWKQNRQLKETEKRIETAPYQLKTIQQQLNKLDQLYFSDFDQEVGQGQDYLLEAVNKLAKENRVQLVHYPGEHHYTGESLSVTTHILTFKGTFHRLIKMMYQFENSYKTFKIASVKLYSELNRKTKRYELFMEVHIQQLNNTK